MFSLAFTVSFLLSYNSLCPRTSAYFLFVEDGHCALWLRNSYKMKPIPLNERLKESKLQRGRFLHSEVALAALWICSVIQVWCREHCYSQITRGVQFVCSDMSQLFIYMASSVYSAPFTAMESASFSSLSPPSHISSAPPTMFCPLSPVCARKPQQWLNADKRMLEG